MTQQAEIQWSDAEKKIAEVALKKAYEQELKNLVQGDRGKASLITLLSRPFSCTPCLDLSRTAY